MCALLCAVHMVRGMGWTHSIPPEQCPALRAVIDGNVTAEALEAAWRECVPDAQEQKSQQSIDDILEQFILPHAPTAVVTVTNTFRGFCQAAPPPAAVQTYPALYASPSGLNLPRCVDTHGILAAYTHPRAERRDCLCGTPTCTVVRNVTVAYRQDFIVVLNRSVFLNDRQYQNGTIWRPNYAVTGERVAHAAPGTYGLQCVICYDGSGLRGHYFFYKHTLQGGWVCINDSQEYSCPASAIPWQYAVMCGYSALEQADVAAWTALEFPWRHQLCHEATAVSRVEQPVSHRLPSIAGVVVANGHGLDGQNIPDLLPGTIVVVRFPLDLGGPERFIRIWQWWRQPKTKYLLCTSQFNLGQDNKLYSVVRSLVAIFNRINPAWVLILEAGPQSPQRPLEEPDIVVTVVTTDPAQSVNVRQHREGVRHISNLGCVASRGAAPMLAEAKFVEDDQNFAVPVAATESCAVFSIVWPALPDNPEAGTSSDHEGDDEGDDDDDDEGDDGDECHRTSAPPAAKRQCRRMSAPPGTKRQRLSSRRT